MTNQSLTQVETPVTRDALVSRLESAAEMTDMRYSLWGCNNEWIVFLTGTQGFVMHIPWRAYRLEHQEDRSWRVVDVSEISEAAMAADPDFAHDFASFGDGFVSGDMPRKLLQPIIDEIGDKPPHKLDRVHCYLNFGGANAAILTVSCEAVATLLRDIDTVEDAAKFETPSIKHWYESEVGKC